jgi:hypothetical protein
MKNWKIYEIQVLPVSECAVVGCISYLGGMSVSQIWKGWVGNVGGQMPTPWVRTKKSPVWWELVGLVTDSLQKSQFLRTWGDVVKNVRIVRHSEQMFEVPYKPDISIYVIFGGND